MVAQGEEATCSMLSLSPCKQRVMPRALLVYLCLTWCARSSGGPAFVPPTTSSLKLLQSCDPRRSRQSHGSRSTSATRLRSRSMAKMTSSDTVEGMPLERPQNQKRSFNNFFGPGVKVTPKQNTERRETERVLGERIQKKVALETLRKAMVARLPGDDPFVSVENWAAAAGETVESLKALLEAGTTAKQTLVVLNFPNINSLVTSVMRSKVEGDRRLGEFIDVPRKDLEQEATMGFLEAAEKFDPSMGNRFATYAVWYAKRNIHVLLNRFRHLFRVPMQAQQLITKVYRYKKELHAELGREPTTDELARELDMSAQRVTSYLRHGAVFVSSLDKMTGHGAGPDGHYLSADSVLGVEISYKNRGAVDREKMLMSPILAEILQKAVREDLSSTLFRLLTPKERECLVLLYGLQSGEPKKRKDIMNIMGLEKPQQVDAIITRAMSKLRKGCRQEDRENVMSYLSIYRPEVLDDDQKKARDRKRQIGVIPEDDDEDDEEEEEEEEEDEEGKVYDFSNHRTEDLQDELKRYMHKYRIKNGDRSGVEVGSGRGADSNKTEGTAIKSTKKLSKRVASVAAAAASPKVKAKAKKASRGKKPAAGVTEAAATPARRILRGANIDGYIGQGLNNKPEVTPESKKWSGKDEMREPQLDAVDENEKLKKKQLMRRRKASKAKAVKKSPVPVAVGGLEPEPNSREADQLEDLSRLLWDGGEEPEDFLLTYGSPDRPSIQ